MTVNVIKRDGRLEELQLEKLNKVCAWACENLTGVSWSEVAMQAQINFYDGISSKEIQNSLILSAAELISEKFPNYQYVAGRLINYDLRKNIYGQYKPIHLYAHYIKVKNLGYYTPELIEFFTSEEFDIMNSFIDHARDELMTYGAMEQMRGKYLVQNRVTKEIYETPQMAYILIAATIFCHYPKKTRMHYIKNFYDAISKGYISLATPVLAGVRTNQKQFSSCVLITMDDDLDSINSAASSIVKYVSQKAGIGVNMGRIRAINSPIRNGDAFHTGLVPFVKYIQSATRSCSQGSIRSGAATCFFPIWHYEVEDLLVLKNNKGTEETRVRHMDYAFQFNRLFYQRFLKDENVSLFSPSETPGLIDAFYEDYHKFVELYEKYEKDVTIRKKVIKATDLFNLFLQERLQTGRIYLMNIDNVNNQGMFNIPVEMSNLCMEIVEPNKPLYDMNDQDGEIALCTLAAINWGKIKEPDDFEQYCDLIVRALDTLISYQNYMVKAAESSSKGRRMLGVGINNFAFWLVKNSMSYSDFDPEIFDTWMQAFAFYMTKSSINLAKELGSCEFIEDVDYHEGTFPMDKRNKNVDEIVPHEEKYNWDELREEVLKFGIRNSTLMAQMPCESSSQVINATNGIEPPRGLVNYKKSKDGVIKHVVPQIQKFKNKYELLWDMPNNDGYLKIVAIMQKYMDQAISVNLNYNPDFFDGNKIPLSIMMRDVLTFYKYGGKNLYYSNTKDGAGEIKETQEEKITDLVVEENDCESCKL